MIFLIEMLCFEEIWINTYQNSSNQLVHALSYIFRTKDVKIFPGWDFQRFLHTLSRHPSVAAVQTSPRYQHNIFEQIYNHVNG